MTNVNINTIISYVKDGEVHHFMDDYDSKGKNKKDQYLIIIKQQL